MQTKSLTQPGPGQTADNWTVERAVTRRIAACPYSFVFNRIRWSFDRGRLTLRGSVPSFYLKQVLQELLRDVEHVRQIINDVNVVSSRGLSSARDDGSAQGAPNR